MDCSATFCGNAVKPGVRGLGVGIRAIAFPLGSMDIWVEGEGVFEQVTIIRVQDPAGNRTPSAVDYPWSYGFSGGAGAELALTGKGDIYFSPGFRFRYVPADPSDSEPDMASVKATFMLFEVGFREGLGRA